MTHEIPEQKDPELNNPLHIGIAAINGLQDEAPLAVESMPFANIDIDSDEYGPVHPLDDPMLSQRAYDISYADHLKSLSKEGNTPAQDEAAKVLAGIIYGYRLAEGDWIDENIATKRSEDGGLDVDLYESGFSFTITSEGKARLLSPHDEEALDEALLVYGATPEQQESLMVIQAIVGPEDVKVRSLSSVQLDPFNKELAFSISRLNGSDVQSVISQNGVLSRASQN